MIICGECRRRHTSMLVSRICMCIRSPSTLPIEIPHSTRLSDPMAHLLVHILVWCYDYALKPKRKQVFKVPSNVRGLDIHRPLGVQRQGCPAVHHPLRAHRSPIRQMGILRRSLHRRFPSFKVPSALLFSDYVVHRCCVCLCRRRMGIGCRIRVCWNVRRSVNGLG